MRLAQKVDSHPTPVHQVDKFYQNHSKCHRLRVRVFRSPGEPFDITKPFRSDVKIWEGEETEVTCRWCIRVMP